MAALLKILNTFLSLLPEKSNPMKNLFFPLITCLLWACAADLSGQTFLSENFNQNTIPPGWQVEDAGTGFCKWKIQPSSTAIPMLGSNYLFVNSDSAGAGTVANETITSPLIPLGSGNQVFLSFRHFFRKRNNRADTGRVEVFSNGAWTEVLRVTTETGSNSAPLLQKLDISAYASPEFRIRFRYKSLRAWYWAIDDLKISSPFPADIGVQAVLQPEAECGATLPFNPKVLLKNYGTLAQSGFPVLYKLAGQDPVSEVFTASLLPGDSSVFVFNTQVSSVPGDSSLLRAWTALGNDSLIQNDTASARIPLAPPGVPPLFFTGFDGTNLGSVFPGWREASGLDPAGTTSAWGAATSGQNASLGSETARINLYTTGKREWIISPAFAPVMPASLLFRVAVTNWNNAEEDEMGSDDSLIVKLSTDCGQTWKNLKYFTAADNLSNELTSFSVSLAAYTGQTIQLAFYGSEGSTDDANDYDVHIDDIRLGVLLANDAQLSSLLIPDGPCGVPASFPVRAKVLNNGSAAQSGIPLTYRISGQPQVSQVFPVNLAAGADTILEFSSPAVIPAEGNYSISAWVELPVDSNRLNDSIIGKSFFLPQGSFPLQNFTGYNGNNLSAGWEEVNGVPGVFNPGSVWSSSNAAQTTGLGGTTARVSLSGAFLNEWLLSPPFIIGEDLNVLRFKTALTGTGSLVAGQMGSDDSLSVYITNNCGQTWKRLWSLTRNDAPGNSLTEQSIPLSSYLGQTVRIAFNATEGQVNDPESYDLHLDQVRLDTAYTNDLQLASLLIPGGNCGAPASFNPKVRLVNAGALPQQSAALSYRISGQNPVSEVFTISLLPGADTILQFSVPVSLPLPGNYSISAWVSLSGDGNPGNDSTAAIPLLRNGPGFQPQGFTGFDGSNLSEGWEEFSGSAAFLIPGSAWQNSLPEQTAALGSVSARINLYTNTRKEWILSPSFNPLTEKSLRYRIALTNWQTASPDSMGSDDSLIVKISTDCGQTWQNLRYFTRTDQLSNQFITDDIPLTSYTGQTIRLAFYATDGSVDDVPDYDLHIDSIRLVNLVPADIGVSTLLLPSLECGLPSSLPVKVRVANFGTAPQAGFQVSYAVNNGAVQTETFPGTLNSGAEQEFQFSVPADFSASGSYLIKAWTTLSGDQDPVNDTLSSIQLNTTPELLSPVNFTSYDGSNLSLVFPGWTEKSGSSPLGTTSFWNASNASQTSSLGSTTARVGLSGNTRREWIVGPGFRPAPQSELRFSLAVTDRNFSVPDFMGSDDSLKVMISTNCGQTWVLLRAFTAQNALPNTLTPFNADLSAYAGQDCQVAFAATDGNTDNPEDYEIHLDDVKTGPLTTSVSTLSGQSAFISVIPNPSAPGIIRLLLSEGQKEPRFFSVTGKEYFPARSADNANSFDTSGMPPGFYYVRTSQSMASFVLK